MLHAAALHLASRGKHVFPCGVQSKEPACARGCLAATTDAALINAWWCANPRYNIGLATGAVSGVFVVDVDSADAEAELARLEAEHGEPLPATIESITAKGRHVYFRYPSGQEIRNSAGAIAPGLDIRGTGGFTVVPPSVHPCGRPYAWSVDSADHFADAPAWLLRLIAAKSGGNGKAATPPEQWRLLVGNGVDEGSRNHAVAKLAGHMLRRNIDPHVARELLQSWNAVRCRPPLDAKEVETILDSIASRELRRRGGPMTDKKADNVYRLADLMAKGGLLPPAAEESIALLFAEQYAFELRHVAAWGWWLNYDSTRWARDDTLHAFDRARAICREIATDCEKSAHAVASAKTVAAVERLAKADRRLAATVAQWDGNGWEFNTGDDNDDSRDV